MSGLIPRPFIDELLNRTDIVELIDGYVPLKKRGNSHLACCPFHNEKTPSFNVVAKKQFYHCFGCGASGNAISFIMNYQTIGFVEAIELLAARQGMSVPREGNHAATKPAASLYQLLSDVAKFYQDTLKTSGHTAIHYLKSRQVSGTVAKLYELGYAPSGWHGLENHFRANKKELITTGMLVEKDNGQTYDRYRHRLIFPIRDRHGRIVGFGGRSIEAEQKPKYLNSPETVLFQKNRELYGLHQVLQQNDAIFEIVIVEGYMDVIALAQHGITTAVATLGTATSFYHIQILSKHTKKLVFCFDGDSAGRQAAWRALENTLPHLNSGLSVGFVFLPEGHDPDSLVREEGQASFLQRVQKATPFDQFFFQTLLHDVDQSTLAGKSQLVNLAKPHLLKMEEGPYRQLLIDELARLTRIESHRIHQLIHDNVIEKAADINVNITRTPLRLAIALLIQHPELCETCWEPLQNILLDDPKQAVLHTLLEQIRQNPGIRTGALIEFWRDTSMFASMNKLAAWDHQVPEAAIEKEFLDNVLFLAKQNHDKKITQLLEKARNTGLTEMDRLHLQEMLKQRHKSAIVSKD